MSSRRKKIPPADKPDTNSRLQLSCPFDNEPIFYQKSKRLYNKPYPKISYLEYLHEQEAILKSDTYTGRKAYFRSSITKKNYFCHVQRMLWCGHHSHIFLCSGGFYEKRHNVVTFFGTNSPNYAPINRDVKDMLMFCDAFINEINDLPNLRCKFVARVEHKKNSVFCYDSGLSLFEIEKFEDDKGNKGFLIRKVWKTTARREYKLKIANKAFNLFFKEVFDLYQDFRTLFDF